MTERQGQAKGISFADQNIISPRNQGKITGNFLTGQQLLPMVFQVNPFPVGKRRQPNNLFKSFSIDI